MNDFIREEMERAGRHDYERGRLDGREEGREEGFAEGRVDGKLEGLAALVKDGLLTLDAAADGAHVSREDLKEYLRTHH